MTAGGTRQGPHEFNVVEAAVDVGVATAAVEVEVVATAPVEVAKLSNGTRRRAQGPHSARAPPGPEPKEPVSVLAPHDTGTPTPARHNAQEGAKGDRARARCGRGTGAVRGAAKGTEAARGAAGELGATCSAT
jgi:hypothetical protein